MGDLNTAQSTIRLAELRGLRAMAITISQADSHLEHRPTYDRLFEMLDELEAQDQTKDYPQELVHALLAELKIMYVNTGGNPEDLKRRL